MLKADASQIAGRAPSAALRGSVQLSVVSHQPESSLQHPYLEALTPCSRTRGVNGYPEVPCYGHNLTADR